MRAKQLILPFLTILSFLISGHMEAQNMRNSSMSRRGLTQAQGTPEKPKPMTAEELVDAEMPKLLEITEFNEFEEAILRSILTKYVQQRIEVQILKLSPEKSREAYETISRNQDAELKASLPEDKYLALKEYSENGGKKPKDRKKKKKKNKS